MPSNYEGVSYERNYRVQRRPDVTYSTTDPWEAEEAMRAFTEGRATTLAGIYGMVLSIKPLGVCEIGLRPGTLVTEICIRPTGRPEQSATQTARDLTGRYFPITFKEDEMKVFEGIVVKVDDKGEISELAKVVAPFLAKDANVAQKTILVDYARESSLSGKEAASLRVSVREFCAS